MPFLLFKNTDDQEWLHFLPEMDLYPSPLTSPPHSLRRARRYRFLKLNVTLRDHVVQPCHFMDKETKTQFLRNLPPLIHVVRKTARARTPVSRYPVLCFCGPAMMPQTGYLTVIQEMFLEALLSVRHYSGPGDTDMNESNSCLLDLCFSVENRQWTNRKILNQVLASVMKKRER